MLSFVLLATAPHQSSGMFQA